MRQRIQLPPYGLKSLQKPWHMLGKAEASIAYHHWEEALPGFVKRIETLLESEGIGWSSYESGVAYLNDVGRWLLKNSLLEELQLSKEMRGKTGSVLMQPDRDVDLETASLCNYVGYLLSETLRRAVPESKYEQCNQKSHVHFQWPTLIREGKAFVRLQPVNVTLNFVRTNLEGAPNATSLGNIFEFWHQHLRD